MNIKNTLIFSFIVLLYSCASSSWLPQNSHETLLASKVTEYSELRTDDGALKAEAMNIETGERFLQGNVFPEGVYYSFDKEALFKKDMLDDCKRLTGSECRLSRYMDEVYYENHEELVAFVEKRKEEYQRYLADTKESKMQNNYPLRTEVAMQSAYQIQLQNKEEEASRKRAVIQALKDRCISYGFEGSNNIAACVQREAQHDYEIEQKEYELRLTKAKLDALTAQQTYVEEEPSLWLSILGALAEGVAEGYKQSQIISALDQRYEPRNRDIYRYCRPNC